LKGSFTISGKEEFRKSLERKDRNSLRGSTHFGIRIRRNEESGICLRRVQRESQREGKGDKNSKGKRKGESIATFKNPSKSDGEKASRFLKRTTTGDSGEGVCDVGKKKPLRGEEGRPSWCLRSRV